MTPDTQADRHMNLETLSLLELLIAAKNSGYITNVFFIANEILFRWRGI